ncbi:YciI family protein [Streptomyces sporangiiformans]|nr:YciI family protein [Streptomyces sporangiiformans]
MMRYLALLKAARPTTPPPPELMEAIMKLGEDATNAGSLLDTAGLAPSAMGSRVSLSEGKLTVTDGPFAEAKEIISYALYEVRTKEEVVEWTSRFMQLHRDLWPGWEGDAEVLKVMGPEDFASPASQTSPA